MIKIMVPAAAIVFAFLAGPALADEASGTVQRVDPGARTLMLDDGTRFIVGESVNLESLVPGTEVTVSYEIDNGERLASHVQPME